MTMFRRIFNPRVPQPAAESRHFGEPDGQLSPHWATPVANVPRYRTIGHDIGVRERRAMTNVKIASYASGRPWFERGAG